MAAVALETEYGARAARFAKENGPMTISFNRRQLLASAGAAAAAAALPRVASAVKNDPKTKAAIEKGLKWIAKTQSSLGHWTAGGYPTAMTALAGTALTASGSTTVQ